MKLRVLIADDSKLSRRFIREIVEASGHCVVDSVGDGMLALESFKQNAPDVVLLDITMPNMSGKQCLVEILKLNSKANVVMISALAASDLEAECLKLGANAFLSKSLNETPQQFNQAIAGLLDKIVNGGVCEPKS